MKERDNDTHKCPVCGKYEFDEYDSYDICPVCGWEDDAYQIENPDDDCGANNVCLNKAIEMYKQGKKIM